MDWSAYCAWTHETAMRKASSGTDDREKAELMEIWGLGLGGEMLEMLAEIENFGNPLWTGGGQTHLRVKVVEEGGDAVYYLARLYVDTGNRRSSVVLLPEGQAEIGNTLQGVCRHVGRVVETVKKALRKHGRPGVVSLSLPASTCLFCCNEGERYERETGANALDHPGDCSGEGELKGRREEFGALLDLALAAFEGWLIVSGSSLAEVMAANVVKLEKRRADGTIGQVQSRLEKPYVLTPENQIAVRLPPRTTAEPSGFDTGLTPHRSG